MAAALVVLSIFGNVKIATAADHYNLEEGLLVEMEDAYPTAYLNREVQFQARWVRTAEGNDQAGLNPRIEVGFARNWQDRINVPFRIGSGDMRGSGDVGVEVFYNFKQESLSVPALALGTRAVFPTGEDSEGVDTTFKLLATKTLGKSNLLHRLNPNVAYTRNASPLEMERTGLWKLVFGYMRQMGPDTAFLTDYVNEQEYDRDKRASIFELGIRHQLTPLAVLGVGGSTGLHSDAPDFRLTFAVQHSS